MERATKSAQHGIDREKKDRLNAFSASAGSYISGDRVGGAVLMRKASCACGGGCPACNSGLKVSRPDDAAEIEADRTADRIMRMPEASGTRPPGINGGGLRISRRISAGSAQPGDVSPSVSEVLRSPGEPLNSAARSFMEPRFGYDFGNVRVHTGEKAAASAESVSALAYTVGSNVVFGTGRYSPETSAGKRLLAHELTHVVQQENKMVRPQLQRDKDPAKPDANACKMVDVFSELDPGLVLPSAYFRNGEGIYKTETDSAKDRYRAALEKSKKGNCVTEANFSSIVLKWDLGNPKLGKWWTKNINKDSQSIDVKNHLIYSRKPCCACFSGTIGWSINVSATRTFDLGKPTEHKETGKTAAPLAGSKKEGNCKGTECCSVNKTFPVSIWMGDSEVRIDFNGTMTLTGSIFPEES